MMRELYSNLTAREQRALRWSAAATAAVLWLSMAWADPWFLLAVPLTVAGFFVYRARRSQDEPDDDDADWL
jgi:hypothetical protein